MRQETGGALLVEALGWLRLRAREGSTWVGLAMIAVVLGSDPMQAHGLAQAISLIIGGGLVSFGPTAGSERAR
jgi:hypothetical protein